ncbi:transglycosylase SLT domain-containing protein [Parvibaculum sp.]|uniref:transglycosylase SLT domain-containing protein n=1 Tax=Parvibaculum sp. TaxID=2024848 RepID=UPI002C9E6D74|nr:transglycosylase SLT domain-containing protein [Parvibaculum sp.]HUD52869.1 transglycosylase SLT domain-containing protein [Parvibaculum sp.]
MPRALLVSVSMAEAGRFDPKSGKARPWPWTINAEGQSFYFDSKKEAVAATQRLLKAGVRSIDVGCMQVNLRYHPDAFSDLHEAFEPLTNVTYGAEFLKRLRKQTGSWPKAVATYHSESPIRNEPYFAKVIRIWTGERERVAALTRALKAEAAAEIAASRGAQVAESPITDVVIAEAAAPSPSPAPAPMVLDTAPVQDIREGGVATVGLRLSIADKDFPSSRPAANRQPPRVLDPAPTIIADASTPDRL